MHQSGLDVSRYRSTAAEVPEREFKTLQSQISDAERFAQAEPLRILCQTCHAEAIFDGLAQNAVRPVFLSIDP